MSEIAVSSSGTVTRTKLNPSQITGFWAAWAGWTLDGMDSVIYALVLSPALTELLPKSGIKATPGNVGYAGSVLFALFLIGWGLSLIWGPIADRFGRTRVLAATIFVYAVFTGAAALSQNVWQLALFRLLAGVGIGGEWALAGTYVAEAWPEDRRKMGAGYLQTGYYAGFFLASALNYTVGAHYGWRAMFWCGLTPVVVAFIVLRRVKEPERWEKKHKVEPVKKHSSLATIFSGVYLRRTVVNTVLLAAAICGLWAGAVYAPTAIIALAKKAGMLQAQAVRTSSFGMGLLSLGNHPRVSCCTAAGGAHRQEAHPGNLFRWDGGVYPAQLRLGVLSGGRTEAVHHCAVLPRLFRRQFCCLQFMAAGAVWHFSPRDCFRLHYIVWTLHRRGSQFRDWFPGRPHGHTRKAGRDHRNRVRDRSAGDSVRSGDARESSARLKGPRDEESTCHRRSGGRRSSKCSVRRLR